MRSEFRDGRLYLHRSEEERAPLLQRLARIEGQVRGLQQMIREDRYCGDELQQLRAILAATREVMRLIAAQHIEAGITHGINGDPPREETLADIDRILQTILREQ